MEWVGLSETSANFYQTTRWHDQNTETFITRTIATSNFLLKPVVSQLPRNFGREIDLPENLNLHKTTQPQAKLQTYVYPLPVRNSISPSCTALILCKTNLYPITDYAMNFLVIMIDFMKFKFWNILRGLTEWVRTLDVTNTRFQTQFIAKNPCPRNIYFNPPLAYPKTSSHVTKKI